MVVKIMVNEIPKGLTPSNLETLFVKKMIIAEMEHNDSGINKSLFNKRLLSRLELKSPNEYEQKTDYDFTDPSYDKNLRNASKKADLFNVGGWRIFKRHRINKEYKKEELEENIEVIKDLRGIQISAFIVKQNERALFLQTGMLLGEVPPGAWEIENQYQASGTEIIWMDITEAQYNPTFIEISTKNYAKVGVHAIIFFKIKDTRRFFLSIVSSQNNISQDVVESYITKTVEAIFRDEISKIDVKILIHDRGTIETAIKAQLSVLFDKWGLELGTFKIGKVKLPLEIERQQESFFKGEIDDEQAKIDAERQLGRMELDGKIDNAELKAKHSLDIQKINNEIEKQNSMIELELSRNEIDKLKTQLQVEKAQILSEKSDIERDNKFKDGVVEADISEAKGLAGARITEATNAAAESLRKHELEMAKLSTNKDIAVAQAQYHSNASGTSTPPIDVNQKKIAAIDEEISQRNKELSNLDSLIMNNKITKEIYEMRAKLIADQINDLREDRKILKRS